MASVRTLVTGANGLLGQALTDRLAPNPRYKLLATGRDADTVHPLAPEYEPLDITDSSRMEAVCKSFRPEILVNAAAMTQVDVCEEDQRACWQVNAEAVAQMATICQEQKIHLVHLSTDFVFSGSDGPYTETDQPDPVNFYGKSKLAAEQAVQKAKLDRWSILRTVLVYGTGHQLKRSNISLWLIDQLRQNQPVTIVTDQWRTPTYVPDLAKGIEQLITEKQTGLYHLSGAELLSVYTFAKRLAKGFGFDPSLVKPTTSSALNQLAKRPPRTGFNIQKAKKAFGFQPRPLETALHDLRTRLDLQTTTSTKNA